MVKVWHLKALLHHISNTNSKVDNKTTRLENKSLQKFLISIKWSNQVKTPTISKEKARVTHLPICNLLNWIQIEMVSSRIQTHLLCFTSSMISILSKIKLDLCNTRKCCLKKKLTIVIPTISNMSHLHPFHLTSIFHTIPLNHL